MPTPSEMTTPYRNTIPKHDEVPYPGDRKLEKRVEALIRWNAMAMVHGQNKKDAGIGGHISTYSSLATLLEVGFNHFFRAKYLGDGRTSRETLSTFRGTLRRVCMRGLILKGGSMRTRLKNFRHELRDTPGLSVVSASVADAGFLEFSYGVDGDRAAECDLSGAVYAVSGESRAD